VTEGLAPGHANRFRTPSVGRILIHVVLIVGSLLCLFPFIFMILKSFNSVFEATRWPPVWIPERWRVLNYSVAWGGVVPFGPRVEVENVPGLCDGICDV
jgi:ABC-type glycerol-3-phosphate transport system permease component